jgi:hypothetical protein
MFYHVSTAGKFSTFESYFIQRFEWAGNADVLSCFDSWKIDPVPRLNLTSFNGLNGLEMPMFYHVSIAGKLIQFHA